jgi:flagellar basal body-associated protein FliL
VAVAALAPRTPAEAPLDAGYAHSATVWISPRVLRWVAPVAVVALVVLLFLPWTGVYPGGHRVYSQNAFQTIWGGVSVDPVGAEALDHVKPYDKVGANRWMLLYTLLVLLALVMVLAPLWLTSSRVQTLRPIVRSLWRWRLELLGAVALAAFVLLMIQLWTGFGLEAAVAAQAARPLASELAAAKTPAERETAKIHQGLAVGPFSLGRTLWLHLAVFGHVLLLAGLGLQLWLVWRGTRPLPRIDGHA